MAAQTMLNKVLRRGGSSPTQQAKKPVLEGPLMVMEMVQGGKDVRWSARHCQIFADATLLIFVKKEDRRPQRTAKLTGDHFVADAKGFSHGWQISDLDDVLYFASASDKEKLFWMHAVAGVVRRLMEPLDALPPQYATVAMHRHSQRINRGPAFDATVVELKTDDSDSDVVLVDAVPPSPPAEETPRRRIPPPPPPPPPPPASDKNDALLKVSPADDDDGARPRVLPLPPASENNDALTVSPVRDTPPPLPPPRDDDDEEDDTAKDEDLDVELASSRASLAKERAVAESLRAEVARLENELADARESLKSEKAAREQAASSEKREVEELRARATELGKALDEATGELAAARSELDHARESSEDEKWLAALELERKRTTAALAETKELKARLAEAEETARTATAQEKELARKKDEEVAAAAERAADERRGSSAA